LLPASDRRKENSFKIELADMLRESQRATIEGRFFLLPPFAADSKALNYEL